MHDDLGFNLAIGLISSYLDQTVSLIPDRRSAVELDAFDVVVELSQFNDGIKIQPTAVLFALEYQLVQQPLEFHGVIPALANSIQNVHVTSLQSVRFQIRWQVLEHLGDCRRQDGGRLRGFVLLSHECQWTWHGVAKVWEGKPTEVSFVLV